MRSRRFAVPGLVVCTFAGLPGAAIASDWSIPAAPPLQVGGCLSPNAFPIGGAGGCLNITGGVAASVGSGFSRVGGTLAAPVHVSSHTDLNVPTAQARLNVDVRLPTELGPVRAYVSLRNRR